MKCFQLTIIQHLRNIVHFVGNYGNAWWKQKEEFESFNGPILMTTNCIVPPKDSYKDRLFTTGAAGFKGCTHIDRKMKMEIKISQKLLTWLKNVMHQLKLKKEK